MLCRFIWGVRGLGHGGGLESKGRRLEESTSARRERV